MNVVAEISTLLENAGRELYGNECVSQLDHALQCAALAEAESQPPELIAAALLHDVGHIVDKRFRLGLDTPVDRRHEDIGAAFLAKWFPPAVTEPIRLHVPAKRYLCNAEKGYFETLSPASVRSLELQGGPFSDAEAQAFIELPYAPDAVDLRRWDDLAKDARKVSPPLRRFLIYVEQVQTGAAA